MPLIMKEFGIDIKDIYFLEGTGLKVSLFFHPAPAAAAAAVPLPAPAPARAPARARSDACCSIFHICCLLARGIGSYTTKEAAEQVLHSVELSKCYTV